MGSEDPVARLNDTACSNEFAHTGPLRPIFKCIRCEQHWETARPTPSDAEVGGVPVSVFVARVAREPLNDFVPNAPSSWLAN